MKPHGSVCPQFWILRDRSPSPGASISHTNLMRQRLRVSFSCQGRVWRPVMSIFDDITVFQIASFSSCSPSTLESRVFEKHRFQIAPLSIAFSNCSVFGVVVWTTDVSGAKQLCFRFENGLVLTGP